MKERKRKAALLLCLAALLLCMIASIESAVPKIRIKSKVSVDRFEGRNSKGEIVWDIGNVNRIGPGGYAPINYCITNEDPDFALHGFYVCFILDPEKTIGGDWDYVAEQANGPTGYRWDFGDNLKYAIANTYLLQLMGNFMREFYNVFHVKDKETVDLNVCLTVTDLDVQEPGLLKKLVEEDIFGVTMEIPDLEPTTRAGKHSWCVEEGIKLEWYERIKIAGAARRGSFLADEHIYPMPYILVHKNARIGEEHKVVALVCSADANSIWQWTSFNVISYEEIEFIIEKPQVSQTLAIGVFIAFAVVTWYTKLWKKIGLGG